MQLTSFDFRYIQLPLHWLCVWVTKTITFAVNKFDLKNSVSIKSEIQGFQTIWRMHTPNEEQVSIYTIYNEPGEKLYFLAFGVFGTRGFGR